MQEDYAILTWNSRLTSRGQITEDTTQMYNTEKCTAGLCNLLMVQDLHYTRDDTTLHSGQSADEDRALTPLI